ncbi:MAG: HEAT repeat domain-containing protein [Patescibacteria group bacterium]
MKEVLNSIKDGDFSILDSKVYSEDQLRKLAEQIKGHSAWFAMVKEVILNIPNFGRNFDWNTGSILQHLGADVVVDVLRTNSEILLNSVGLAWVLGEFRNTNRIITDFLYFVVKNGVNSDAWWRAAFSLEKLGVEEAVNLLKMSLKKDLIKDLDFYLNKINNKRSLVAILILSNVENIEQVIYPSIKKTFLEANDDATIINCCWLVGRLKLIDTEIYEKLLKLIVHSNYELKYYTFFALQYNATERLRPILEKALNDTDPLIRKMAARGLMNIGNEQSLKALNDTLYKEGEESVVSEVSRAIYNLKNPADRTRLLLEIKSYRNENGMISDESDKWYRDPGVYHTFSEAEDPENICFSLIQKRIGDTQIKNPIDLATGTGRMIWQILEKMPFVGTLFAVDASEQMCDFVTKIIKRERKFTNNIKVINSDILDTKKYLKQSSTFIISSFGFPSRISDVNLCIDELRAVETLLDPNGLFFTIGWDETFNDDLNKMWFKFIPDKIPANNFEEWRQNRATAITSPRNTNLSWLKKGIAVPLQFASLKESAFVMGYLFGRDAAQYVVNSGKTEWSMSLGITCNTKEELRNIIQSHERN